MKALEDKILQEGSVLPGDILKVGSFLNQQIDVSLLMQMGSEVARLFADAPITRVLTIEASGIAFAVAIASALHVPAVYAKKHASANVSGELYSAEVYSYTHQQTYEITVPKSYLHADDHVLLADDFLGNGEAAKSLMEIVRQSGATLEGIAIEIEKGFQPGGQMLRKAGVRLESLAIIKQMDENGIVFGLSSI